MRFQVRFSFVLILFFLPACYHMVQKDKGLKLQDAPLEARRFLSVIEAKNDAVTSFKAIGKIRIWDSDGSQTSRAAWLGAADGRLRIEFLGLPGQPVAKFIFDGTRYFFISHLDSQFYEKNSSDPDLGMVTGVSIKASEVIEFLAGGVPVYEHDSVLLEQSASGDNTVLIFKKDWLGVVERIFFNGSDIEKVEVFKWGMKAYQAEFKDPVADREHHGPDHLVITNGENQGFSFNADRQWADIHVLPSMFEPSPVE